MRKIIPIFLILILSLSLPSCVPQGSHFGEQPVNTAESKTDAADGNAATIVFSDNRYIFTGDPSSISCEGATIYIVKGGTYKLSGRLRDGCIVIDAGEECVRLVLCGIEISAKDFTPITVRSASEAIIETERGTENIIECEDTAKSAIASDTKLTLINNGSLSFNGLYLTKNKS